MDASNYKASPFLKKDPYKPEVQHFGEGAGGCGSMGRSNEGEDHRQSPDPKGTYGPDISAGQPSAYARGLIARSTGVQVNDGQNPGTIYGKRTTY